MMHHVFVEGRGVRKLVQGSGWHRQCLVAVQLDLQWVPRGRITKGAIRHCLCRL